VKKSNRRDAEIAEAAKKSKEVIVWHCILCDLSASAVRFLILCLKTIDFHVMLAGKAASWGGLGAMS
jgi:hypothetical protein